MSKRDYIYYDYIFKKIIPKNKIILIYCKLRKIITIGESPSKVMIWSMK